MCTLICFRASLYSEAVVLQINNYFVKSFLIHTTYLSWDGNVWLIPLEFYFYPLPSFRWIKVSTTWPSWGLSSRWNNLFLVFGLHSMRYRHSGLKWICIDHWQFRFSISYIIQWWTKIQYLIKICPHSMQKWMNVILSFRFNSQQFIWLNNQSS